MRPPKIHLKVGQVAKAKGWTRVRLAKRLRWREYRLYRVLSGRTKLTAVEVWKFSVILDEPITTFYDEAPYVPPASIDARPDVSPTVAEAA